MSLDNIKTSYLYGASALIVVLVILALVQVYKRTPINYELDHIISVKTSRGLIKMNQERMADELSRIYAELARHERGERAGKFREQINRAIYKLRVFIKKNPNNSLCRGDIRANIIQQAEEDLVSADLSEANLAYKVILDGDSNDYNNSEQSLVYLLKNLHVLIQMLKHRVCEDGIIDIEELENILYALDSNITHGYAEPEITINQEFNGEFNQRNSIINENTPRVPLLIGDSGQLENFTSEEMRTAYVPKGHLEASFKIRKGKAAQERSAETQISHGLFGGDHYADEELLHR